MIESDADINLQNNNGNTLLIIAASGGHPSVSKLLSSGANPNIVNSKGQTSQSPLWIAVKNGHETTVSTLLKENYKCDVNCQEHEHGESPLHVAALSGYETIGLLLLSKAERIEVNIKDKYMLSPLHHACIKGHLGIAKQLLNCKADVSGVSSEGYTPLHCAALIGNLPLVDLLLTHGSKIDAKDNRGFTPLALAIRESKKDVVQYMLKRGASVQITTNDNYNLFHIACCRGNLDILTLLTQTVDHSSHTQQWHNLFAQTTEGYTSLHFAAMNGNLPFVKFLLRQHTVFKQKEKMKQPKEQENNKSEELAPVGEQALDSSSVLEYPPVWESLKDKSGYTPKDVAQQYGHTHIVQYFDSEASLLSHSQLN